MSSQAHAWEVLTVHFSEAKENNVDSNNRLLSYNFELAGFVSEDCLDLYFINLK